jgi:hypothetical protein
VSSSKRIAGHVDPLLAVAVGGVLVVGGGLVAWGGGHDTESVASDPTAALTAPAADPAAERALAAVQDADEIGAAPQRSAAAVARAAARASERGAARDPFSKALAKANRKAEGASATPRASTAGAASSSAGKAATPTPSAPVATPSTGVAPTPAATPKRPAAVGGGSEADHAKAVAATRRASTRVSLRIVRGARRQARSKLALGTTVPSKRVALARIQSVSDSGKVVTLRLAEGLSLPGKQSAGTTCLKRFALGDKPCKVVRVRAGRTVVLQEPGRKGREGTITAVRVLTVWRSGKKIAGA